jgi:hypothetical protein
MMEPGGDLDFTHEPVAVDDRARHGPEDLERDLAPVLEVAGEEDVRHPAATDPAHHRVPVREGRGQTFENLGHGSGRYASCGICGNRVALPCRAV